MKFQIATSSDLNTVKNLYFEAFPKHERKPFCMIKNASQKQCYDLFVLKDDNNAFIGFAFTFLCNDIVMVDYLAISPDYRGLGAGSTILKYISDTYSDKRIMLFMEYPDPKSNNFDQRMKRKQFYLKNGYTETGITLTGIFGDMSVLSYGGSISEEECIYVQTKDLGKFLMIMSRIRLKTN